jgi:signal peptidase
MSAVEVASPAVQTTARPGLVRVLLRLAVSLGAGICLPLAVIVIAPTMFGFHFVTILSGSMTPTLRVGDVVLERRIAPLQAKVGDVVTFKAPNRPGETYTHRVVSIRVRGDRAEFVTQGDANTSSESWSVPVNGNIGLARFHVPKIGYVTNRAGSRVGRLGLIVVPVLLLGLYEFRRIWSEPSEDKTDDAAAA